MAPRERPARFAGDDQFSQPLRVRRPDLFVRPIEIAPGPLILDGREPRSSSHPEPTVREVTDDGHRGAGQPLTEIGRTTRLATENQARKSTAYFGAREFEFVPAADLECPGTPGREVYDRLPASMHAEHGVVAQEIRCILDFDHRPGRTIAGRSVHDPAIQANASILDQTSPIATVERGQQRCEPGTQGLDTPGETEAQGRHARIIG